MRLPLPGRPVALYADFYADDEPSPLASPRRSGFDPGIYIATIPGLPQWDLRVEAPSTRLATSDHGGTFLYWNNVYNDANTNQGYLLGNWVGRDGRGLFIQSTWWRSGRSKVEFSYRQNRIGPAFLPGGGTQDDAPRLPPLSTSEGTSPCGCRPSMSGTAFRCWAGSIATWQPPSN